MFDERLSGVLLHPTSLPGPHGSGDLGPSAYHFVDWLAAAAQRLWQVLPLTPIGPGNSPYMGASAFAGNPLLVALEPLIERGWLAPPDGAAAGGSAHEIDFGRSVPFRMQQLTLAAERFFATANANDRGEFDAYCRTNAAWLDDYALFMTIDAAYQRIGGPFEWPQWEPSLARRESSALAAVRRDQASAYRLWQFVQWQFDRQWQAVKAYANSKDVRIVGDLPIFVAHHSADCWARPDLYFLDAHFAPTVVAGVPPDFFSTTGQRWGNPLYRWDAMQREGFAWWIARLRRQLSLADIVRIDHFRGFAGYWEIPSTCPTAIEGRWVPAPGKALFQAIAQALGKAPIIAEDLGVITPDVVALRDGCGFPGMRILQFAFSSDAANPFLPHNYVPRTVVYTGTHDNDTAVGWWTTATDRERAYAEAYLNVDFRREPREAAWAMVRAASASVAQLALFPMQDILALDGSHRMNTPSQLGCWQWRFGWDLVPADCAARLAAISATYGRAPLDRLNLAAWPQDRPQPV